MAWWRECQDRLFELLDETPINDVAARDRINLNILLIRKMKKSFEQYSENGEVSKKELRDLLEMKEQGLLGKLREVMRDV